MDAMSNLRLPPKDVEKLRLTEPLSCPSCRAGHGRPNYNLSVFHRGTTPRQTGIAVRCSVGHVSLAMFVPLDGMVFHNIVPVDSPGGDGVMT